MKVASQRGGKPTRVRCEDCPHRSTGIFRQLGQAEASEMTAIRDGTEYARGRAVAAEGQPGHGPIIVCSGMVKVLTRNQSGEERLVGCRTPCSVLWHGFERRNLPWSLTAATECEVSFVRQSRFLEFLARYPQVLRALVANQQDEIERLRHGAVAARAVPVRVRLASAILTLSAPTVSARAASSRRLVGLRRRDLADLVGATIESVVRALRRLEAEGVIRRERREIVVVDPDRLARIARVERLQGP